MRDVGLRRAKTNFLQNELNTNWNDSKTFWQQINTLLPKNSNTSIIKLIDNHTPVLNTDIPDYIKNFFANIGPKLAKPMNEPWVYNGIQPDSKLQNIVANIDEVKKLMILMSQNHCTIDFCRE